MEWSGIEQRTSNSGQPLKFDSSIYRRIIMEPSFFLLSISMGLDKLHNVTFNVPLAVHSFLIEIYLGHAHLKMCARWMISDG